jgi:hypothetical protein
VLIGLRSLPANRADIQQARSPCGDTIHNASFLSGVFPQKMSATQLRLLAQHQCSAGHGLQLRPARLAFQRTIHLIVQVDRVSQQRIEGELQRWLVVHPNASGADGFRAGSARLARFVRRLLRKWEARWRLLARIGTPPREISRLTDRALGQLKLQQLISRDALVGGRLIDIDGRQNVLNLPFPASWPQNWAPETLLETLWKRLSPSLSTYA